MRLPSYRSTARAIVIVGVLLSLVPGIIPEARANGTLEFASPWIWTAIIALFALAPYATVLLLSSPMQSAGRNQVARGVAVGAALAAIAALGLSLLVSLYVLLFGRTTLLTVQMASCVLLIAMNVWLLWGAVRGNAVDGIFFGGMLAALAFASVALRVVWRIESAAASGVQTYQRDLYTVERAATGVLRQLAACAATYQMSHGRHLPEDLPALVSAAGCDPALAAASAAPQYRIALAVYPADTVQPGATMGCLFTATFTGKLLGDRASTVDGRALWSTCAGRVYARELRGPSTGTRPLVNTEFPLEVSVVFRNVLLSASESGGRYPATLSALLGAPHLKNPRYVYDANVLGAQQRVDLDSNLFRSGLYVARYIRGSHGFRIEVRCEKYGPACMRGYLVDESGAVRGTGEPRPARITDPPAEQCEFSTGWCDGQPGSLWKPPPMARTEPDGG